MGTPGALHGITGWLALISFRKMGDTLPSLQEALSLVIARSLKATEAISSPLTFP